jgi:hypothetical protein
MDLTDIYRVFCLATKQYTFFSAIYGTFFKMDYILGCKVCLNKYKKIEMTLCLQFDSNTIKLEHNNKRNCRKYLSTWRLKNTLLHD